MCKYNDKVKEDEHRPEELRVGSEAGDRDADVLVDLEYLLLVRAQLRRRALHIGTQHHTYSYLLFNEAHCLQLDSFL